MTRIRYVGPDPEIRLAIPGACLPLEQGQWVDAHEHAEAHGVPGDHMNIIVRGLIDHPYWEIEDAPGTTAKTPRARKRPAPGTTAKTTTTEPGDEPAINEE